MNYSQHTKLAYAFDKQNKIVYRSGELKYSTEAEALAALVSSANKDELLAKAKELLIEVITYHKGSFSMKEAESIADWLELAAALEGAEYVIKTSVQAAIDEANNPLPGANIDYYEHLATSK